MAEMMAAMWGHEMVAWTAGHLVLWTDVHMAAQTAARTAAWLVELLENEWAEWKAVLMVALLAALLVDEMAVHLAALWVDGLVLLRGMSTAAKKALKKAYGWVAN